MPTKARVYKAIDKFHASLLDGETKARQEVGKVYAEIQIRTNERIELIKKKIALAGDQASPSWAYQERRLQSLLKEMKHDADRGAVLTTRSLKKAQLELAMQAQEDQRRLIETIAPRKAIVSAVFEKANLTPVKNMIGVTADGTPVAEVLSKWGGERASELKGTLIEGLAAGDSPAKVARAMRTVTEGDLWPMMRIVRNETVRAYRESTTQYYAANQDVVQGWIWLTAEDERTCPFCLSMQGSKHLAMERLEAHVCCRCSQLPITAGYEAITGLKPELDTSAGKVPIESGQDWLNAQSDQQQNTILGKGAAQAFRDGQFNLKDMYEPYQDPTWGTQYRRRTLEELVGQPAA